MNVANLLTKQSPSSELPVNRHVRYWPCYQNMQKYQVDVQETVRKLWILFTLRSNVSWMNYWYIGVHFHFWFQRWKINIKLFQEERHHRILETNNILNKFNIRVFSRQYIYFNWGNNKLHGSSANGKTDKQFSETSNFITLLRHAKPK